MSKKKVSIIIPISFIDSTRKDAFLFVEKYYKKFFPDYELCIERCDETPFPKSRTINRCVKKSSGDILIIADADILINPKIIRNSIKLLDYSPWIIPFNEVINIKKESTAHLLKTTPEWPVPAFLETVKRPFMGHGGINIVPRNYFDQIYGFDERFVGWGGEDDAFAASLNALCGYVKRLQNSVYHLWHDRQQTGNYNNNVEILKPYLLGRKSIQNEIQHRKTLANRKEIGKDEN
ncbi:galactosyltransferase-related protein [Priestia flexa]|uniref:galactosyltransferase-related protein n=1 Tax=Priestia flexa TaxID=86664 RepID=UPI00095706DD|nr:galactosyltransferase-related protein [Priestia flexa]MBY6088672.1 hypothetical protein [Priestia flexa]QCS53889.1 hypothetical protein FED53_15465 [Priestia flexa]SIR55470.1 N-terminal domain of galactosyltransferase [Priestia flexa]